MLSFSPATPGQYDEFLKMMWDDGQDYWENTLRVMQMTWEEYAQIFHTRGEVFAIFQDDALAGFYWIEERVDTLHLHGLILKTGYQGQGIGTTILTMLANRYSGKLDKIELGVYQANSGAIRLYEKLGYCITKRLDDLQFFIMQKPLAPQIVSQINNNVGQLDRRYQPFLQQLASARAGSAELVPGLASRRAAGDCSTSQSHR